MPASPDVVTQLDLHTAEIPIATPKTDLAVDQLGLDGFIVDGVLTLYAVERKLLASPSEVRRGFYGKAKIYLTGPHWVRYKHMPMLIMVTAADD
jgi:hypothetical protein